MASAQVGRIDIGASIGFLSQYPGEEEYLVQPLACLEVLDSSQKKERGQAFRETLLDHLFVSPCPPPPENECLSCGWGGAGGGAAARGGDEGGAGEGE